MTGMKWERFYLPLRMPERYNSFASWYIPVQKQFLSVFLVTLRVDAFLMRIPMTFGKPWA